MGVFFCLFSKLLRCITFCQSAAKIVHFFEKSQLYMSKRTLVLSGITDAYF